MKVLAVGAAIVDRLICLDSDDLLEILHLPKGSMTMIDETQYLSISSKVDDFSYSLVSGGSSANMACACGMMGVKSAFIGKTGCDSYATKFKQDLIVSCVDPFLFESRTPTGCATTLISVGGERTFATYLGASSDMTIEDIETISFEGYDWVHAEGYLVYKFEYLEHILSKAKRAGCKVALDLATYNMVYDFKEKLQWLVNEYVDMIFANEEESFAYTGLNPEAAALEIAKNCDIAVVKIGQKGALMAQGETLVSADAIKAEVIDTTGAGDLFASGFYYGLSKGYPLKGCAEIGAVVAGNVIEVIGTHLDNERWRKVKAKIGEIEQTI